MCRHIAYLGPSITLESLLIDQPHSLVQQSWAPTQQPNGIMNADGFGVGWYSSDPAPARYRRDRPIWGDAGFADLARVTRSHAVLAAVRSASAGMPFGESACAPFASGRWLFSHNGFLEGYPAKAGSLAATLEPVRLLELEAATDSALLWVLVRDRLERGARLGDSLTEVVQLVAAKCVAEGSIAENSDARMNFLLTDGQGVAATSVGNTLFWRTTDDSVVVASEPYDEEPGWNRVPDNSLLVATTRGVEVSTL